MEQFEIEVTVRQGTGSSEARRVRKSGLIPAVIYAHGDECVAASVGERAFLKIAKLTKSSQVFKLKSTDKALDGRSALVKEVQKDYLAGKVLHVDFQAIREDEEISVRVPLRVVGEAVGVKVDGGILTVVAHEVGIRCLPRFIPADISVDVTDLHIGHSIHAEDLKLPEQVRLSGNPNETIVAVVAIRAAEEEAATTAVPGAAPAEGAAAAAPAEGATPAADAAAPKKDAKK